MRRRDAKAGCGAACSLCLVCLSSALASCGAGRSGGVPVSAEAGPPQDTADAGPPLEGGTTDAAPFQIGSHAPFPQIPSQGGPTLASPHLVTITFDGDPRAAQIAAFGDFVVKSSWFSVVGQDYGIATATHTHVSLGAPPTGTIADADVQTFIAAHVSDATLPSAGADAGVSEYVYAVFYPSGVDVTLPQQAGGQAICSLGPQAAYHWEARSPRFAYAVVPTCVFQGATETLDEVEESASHEFIEAVTDPYPATAPAFALTDANVPWALGGGELADLCEGEIETEGGFRVQRVWSNSAAAAGDRSPCIPFSGPFFDASVSSAAGAPSQSAPVSPGQSVSMIVQGFSTQPMAPWPLQAYVVAGLSAFDPAPVLGAGTIENGESTTLELTVPAGTASQKFATVLVYSRSGSEMHSWPVVVYAP